MSRWPGQLEFDCDGYSDGTSGGPFLSEVDQATGQGLVIGVIGGYQQGGDTPDVSYSPVLGTNAAALYRKAVSGGSRRAPAARRVRAGAGGLRRPGGLRRV